MASGVVAGFVVCIAFQFLRFVTSELNENVRVTYINSSNHLVHILPSGELSIPSERKILLHLYGKGFGDQTVLAFTSKPGKFGDECDASNLYKNNSRLSDFSKGTETLLEVSLPFLSSGSYYLCVKKNSPPSAAYLRNAKWIHQGSNIKLKTYSEDNSNEIGMNVDNITTEIYGVRAEGDKVFLSSDGIVVIQENTNTLIRLFGRNFTINTAVALTTTAAIRGNRCNDMPIEKITHIEKRNFINENVVEFHVKLRISPGQYYYFCVKESQTSRETNWIHQGKDPWLLIEVQGRILPLWVQIILILILLLLSGLFSGLNLGLMALDKNELRVIENCGTETEKKYARTISPLRKRGNYLLCSLLLGNVLVNSTLTILLDDLTSGIIAIIGSTMSIVLFGEIIPQAICSRHGLAIGAQTVIITKFFMLVTFPLSFPISKILDCVLGEEIGNVYDRERLMEFIRVTKDYNKLENEEVNIISGALGLKNKTVADVMTKVEDVFMISHDAILDFETMSEIMKQGYTRIPVYESNKNNIVALLFTKDLAFIDPDDNTPLRTVCEFYNHPITYVFEDETLDTMLDEFKKGNCHMALVRRVNNESDLDPFYEICGVVTLEDVLEELLQSEIVDETDILTDNRRKQRRKETQLKQDFSDFAKLGSEQQGKNIISSQLALATFQYLLTSVEPFKKNYISEAVLRRLMGQNIFFTIKVRSGEESNSQDSEIYHAGTPADYFILIIEGRAKVTVGQENLIFDVGPFTYFGIPALITGVNPVDPNLQSQGSTPSIIHSPDMPNSKFFFSPDYTVTAMSDMLCMKIPRSVYLAAFRATLMERQKRFDPTVDDPFQNAWENDLNISQPPIVNHSDQCNSTQTTSNITNHSMKTGKLSIGTNLNIPEPTFNSKHCISTQDNSSRRASVEVATLSHMPNFTSSNSNSSKRVCNAHRVNSTGNLETASDAAIIKIIYEPNDSSVSKSLEMQTLPIISKSSPTSENGKSGGTIQLIGSPTDCSSEQTSLLFSEI